MAAAPVTAQAIEVLPEEVPEVQMDIESVLREYIRTDREITDTTHLLAEFPSGLTLVVAGSTVNEQGIPDVLRGRKATLHFASSQSKVELKPERIFTDEMEAEDFSDPQPPERIERLEKPRCSKRFLPASRGSSRRGERNPLSHASAFASAALRPRSVRPHARGSSRGVSCPSFRMLGT